MKLHDLPDVSFAERAPALIESNIIGTVERLLQRKLARADPLRLILLGVAAIIVQERGLIDDTGKMNLLAYTKGNYLEHKGALVGTERIAASAAHTTLKLILSAPREMATTIPQGLRVTAGDGVLFALDAPVIIPKGETSALAAATCTVTGKLGNGYAAGELKTIVDPVPFLVSAANTTMTEGGADVESDDSYRERIHEAPEQFSTAGPTGAYVYFAKKASALIGDVSVENGGPGVVLIRPLLKGGALPGAEILKAVRDTLNDDKVRPLTDYLKVETPEVIKYNIRVRYWIDRGDAVASAAIEKRVNEAVTDFVAWQKEKLGRDINPTELYYRIRAAGAKRAEITEPIFTPVGIGAVAIADVQTVTLEGLEDG